MYCVYNKLGGAWDPCEIWKSIDGVILGPRWLIQVVIICASGFL